MTLLTIVQDCLNELGGFEVPSAIVGNANETAVRSLALVNRSLKETARRFDWDGVTVRGTITTVASQEEYTLPSDFKALINQTMWDDTNNRAVSGPLSPVEWETVKNSGLTSSASRWFRIFKSASSNDNVFYLFPTPDGIDTLNFEYRSNALTQTSGGSPQAEKYLADSDTAVLDEDIILLGFKWRFMKSFGLPYAEEFRDYELAVDDGIASTGSDIMDLAGARTRRFNLIVPDGDFTL